MAEEKDTVNMEPSTDHDDPSTKIWSSYISGAERHNRNLAQSWKGDMDAILIFAGLFSASVTAFIIESYKTLRSDTGETTIALLSQISQQLAAMSNSNTPANATGVLVSDVLVTSDTFVPSTSALICNTLWFLSLAFSLISALSATLVEQWVRNYLQAIESRPTPHERARICEYLYKGLEKFQMATLVETIPLFLHISLLLFFAGLVEFLHPINYAMSALLLVMLILCIALYTLATIIPAFRRDCPYQTPLSGACWRLLKTFCLLRRRDPQGNITVISGTMAQAREMDATAISPQRDQRDLDAIAWTLKTLRQDAELEAFVEIIPRVVAGSDYSAKLLLHKLLYYDDLSVRLSHRIPRLLISCTGGVLDSSVSQRRAATCLAAIWSLTMMSVPTDSSQGSPSILFHETLRFDENTLRDIQTIRIEIPNIAGYTTSTITVVARSLLDMYVEQASVQEQNLAEFIRTHAVQQNSGLLLGKTEHIFNKIQHISEVLEQYLDSDQEIASPHPLALFRYLLVEISKLFSLTSASLINVDVIHLTVNTLKILRHLLVMLNQAAFSLSMDYAEALLNSQSMAHEAFNTIRRIFLKINFDLRISVKSQTRFVTYLDDALDSDAEGRTRIPQSIVNIILGLARGVNDPACALKARNIIHRCLGSLPSEDEAQKALFVLDSTLPRSIAPLDLFTSHMYSSFKPDKSNYTPTSRAIISVVDGSTLRRKHGMD